MTLSVRALGFAACFKNMLILLLPILHLNLSRGHLYRSGELMLLGIIPMAALRRPFLTTEGFRQDVLMASQDQCPIQFALVVGGRQIYVSFIILFFQYAYLTLIS